MESESLDLKQPGYVYTQAYWPLSRNLSRFLSIKQLVVLLLPPGWDASPRSPPSITLGVPRNLLVPIHTPDWREVPSEYSAFPQYTTP